MQIERILSVRKIDKKSDAFKWAIKSLLTDPQFVDWIFFERWQMAVSKPDIQSLLNKLINESISDPNHDWTVNYPDRTGYVIGINMETFVPWASDIKAMTLVTNNFKRRPTVFSVDDVSPDWRYSAHDFLDVYFALEKEDKKNDKNDSNRRK